MSNKRNPLLRPLLASLAMLGATSVANAAFTINEQNVDGAWFKDGAANQGVFFDYFPLPNPNRDGVLFVVWFQWDANGQPQWYGTQVDVGIGQFSFTGLQLVRQTGGAINAPTPATGTAFGTMDLTFNTCNSLDITLRPTGQGTQQFNGMQPLAQKNPGACAYTEAFTSCPSGTTAVTGALRTCALPSVVTGDVRLTNSATYVVQGKVSVGNETTQGRGRLFIEPGTLIVGGTGGPNYVVVTRNSQVFSDGTVNAPVVMRGPSNVAGSWAGLVVAGNAQCNQSVGGAPCLFEADNTITFGGGTPVNTESSGSITYTQVLFGGQVIRANEELNGITLLGVGSGTRISHVHVHAGKDDGIEWFGGTANVKYAVLTAIEDDAIDWALGYDGRVQHALIWQTSTSGGDSRGLEGDNVGSGNFDTQPRTKLRAANVSIFMNNAADSAILLRRGVTGQLWNFYVRSRQTNFACLNFNDNATYNVAGSPGALTGETIIRNSHLDCTTLYDDRPADPYLLSAFYTGQVGNTTGEVSNVAPSGATQAYLPAPGSPLLSSGTLIPNDQFFDQVNHKGAFASPKDDWTAGWTFPWQAFQQQ